MISRKHSGQTCHKSAFRVVSMLSVLHLVKGFVLTRVPSVLGTITRTQLWDMASNIQEKILPCDTFNNLSSRHLSKVNTFLRTIPDNSSASEAELYDPIYRVLVDTLSCPKGEYDPGLIVHRTCGQRFLNGLAPDFTLALGHIQKPIADYVYGVIEVKGTKDLLESSCNLGQVYDYLLKLRVHQAHRKSFFGVLTNVKESIIMRMQVRENDEICITKFASVNFVDLMRFLTHLQLGRVTHSQEYTPLSPPFSLSLGIMARRLGLSSKSAVGVFPQCEDSKGYWAVRGGIRTQAGEKLDRNVMAVKCLVSANPVNRWSLQNECYLLRKLRKIIDDLNDFQAPGLSCIPYLVFDTITTSRVEFGIVPVGVPLELKRFQSPEHARCALRSIVAGLQFLHQHSIIHRDIRQANIVLACRRNEQDQGGVGCGIYPDGNQHGVFTPVIIDYDCAIDMSKKSPTTKMVYSGGLICAPVALLACSEGLDALYIPRPQDDLCAFLLLVLAILYPARFSQFRSYRLKIKTSEERMILINTWKWLQKNSVWGKYVTAAESLDYTAFNDISDVFLWPHKIETSGGILCSEEELELDEDAGPGAGSEPPWSSSGK